MYTRVYLPAGDILWDLVRAWKRPILTLVYQDYGAAGLSTGKWVLFYVERIKVGICVFCC